MSKVTNCAHGAERTPEQRPGKYITCGKNLAYACGAESMRREMAARVVISVWSKRKSSIMEIVSMKNTQENWTTFEKVACSLIILFGLVVGWGIMSLGQQVIDAKAQYYAIKTQQENR